MSWARLFEDRVHGFEAATGLRGKALCSELKGHWKKLWDYVGFTTKYGSIIWAGTESRRITRQDVEDVARHLEVSVKCQNVVDTYNELMTEKGIPDDEDPGKCCTVTCPEDLPEWFK